jgi:hypothetical protein
MSAKPRDLPELDWRKVDRTVLRTVATISKAIDRMIADLPEYAAPHMARVRLVRELTRLQPTTMQQIMDDHYTREAYEAFDCGDSRDAEQDGHLSRSGRLAHRRAARFLCRAYEEAPESSSHSYAAMCITAVRF